MTGKFKKAAAMLCCGMVLISAACGRTHENIAVQSVGSDVTEYAVTEKLKFNLPSVYYDEKSFNMHTSAAKLYSTDREILCGTVPHHLLAGELIAGFLKTAAYSREKTDTVIITATMHFTENEPFCTSYCNWDTPFGEIQCDTDITDAIVSTTGAVENDDMAATDHSVSALMPYVKYYFPDAQTAFLLVDRKADKDTPEKLAELFKQISQEKECLFLFSADFSHYLEPDETERHDLETLEAVMSKQYEKVASMTDDNVDSPHVLGTFMKLGDICGREYILLERSNSLIMSRLPYSRPEFREGLTSYFVFTA